MQRSILRRSRLAIVAIAAGSLALTACGAASSGGSNTASTTTGAFGTLPAASGTPIKGGTITYPVTAGSTPTYIMPILPGEDSTVYNQMFQYLMYRPLYYSSIGNRPVPNPTLSLAAPAIYSNGNKTVTINMKHNYRWVDGHPVDAQDVLFFIDELRAAVHPVKTNAANFGNYTPGDFPDNVVSATAPSQYQVVLTLDRAYNPNWFSQTQLSLITPMPSTAWNIAAAGGPHLDFTNPANAKKIYTFLDAEAGKLSTYGSNPLWKDADGPFQLESFTSSTGANTMVANPHYGGPQKPVFDKLQALSFTSLTAEFNAILAGKINQGIIPAADVPQIARVKAAGYNVYGYPNLGFEYIVFNFKDTTNNWDKIIGQLYIRQALAHLQDQAGLIQGVFNGAAAAAYGPVPAVPATNYVPADAATNPYPYSIAAASKLLSDHGWTVRPGGTTTCTRPGTAANQCGAGIPAGANINFTDFYTNDPATAGLETTQLASAAQGRSASRSRRSRRRSTSSSTSTTTRSRRRTTTSGRSRTTAASPSTRIPRLTRSSTLAVRTTRVTTAARRRTG